MGSNTNIPPKPWVETPLIRSMALSQEAGCNIFLKLENLQPSGSFKSRAVGHLMCKAIARHGPSHPIHFYCSSGGNAGLACATAAISLQRPATIVVPLSTSPLMISKLRTLGADVKQVGNHWSEADAYMREELIAGDKNGVYVPPFDHVDCWEGNETLVDEVERQMCGYGGYDAIVASVGGGGLFSGIMAGLSRHGRLGGGGLKRVKVMAVETEGAHSLALSLERGELSRLDAITSIATSLGATQVANQAFEWAKRKEVTSCVFSDAEAAMGAVCFADDERIVVEAACGVSLAAAYNDTLRTVLFPDVTDEEFSKINVVIVVCGGSNITLEILEKYKQEYAMDERVVQKFHSRRLASETLKKVSQS
ncbi:Catabolic L-serine/threonine dehydratase [Lachnellula occidentalis]|uniref:L-serine ammonia-lyase n=1 Tax=Lachnellula occidentalis TaxID=215460 RepID=A0A8H8RVC0_9HELO|nr:Catabolic L-serine/threonine dehydratase [Lachnellula occidentalis]